MDSDSFLSTNPFISALLDSADETNPFPPRTNEPTTDGQNIQSFSAHAQKIVQAARLHANNLLRSADELEKLIDPVCNSALLLRTDQTNAEYNDELEIMESKWKKKLKQLTDNVDKCNEVVDVASPLQKFNFHEIATQGKS